MKETTRSRLRPLFAASAGIGFVMALGWAGTSDTRDALRYEDEETRKKIESTMVSQETENALGAVATTALLAGMIGMMMTEKKQRQR